MELIHQLCERDIFKLGTTYQIQMLEKYSV
jgi:hypothetical protein